MGKEIDLDIREWAEELYIVDGLTFEDVAQKTAVSVSQLKRWAAPEGGREANGQGHEDREPSWTDRRREYRSAMSNIRRDTVLLRKRLISKALKSLDPQDVYAISSLEATAARAKNSEDRAPVPVSAENMATIKTPQDAIDALQGVIEKKINAMLTQPGSISLSGIKEMKQALELIEKMREKYKAKDNTADERVLDSETIRHIREQLSL